MASSFDGSPFNGFHGEASGKVIDSGATTDDEQIVEKELYLGFNFDLREKEMSSKLIKHNVVMKN